MEAEVRIERHLGRYVRSAVLGLGALAIVASPSQSAATGDSPFLSLGSDNFCSQIFVTNTQNQLLRIGRPRELLGDDNFFSRLFGDTVFVRSRQSITGLAAGESLVGIDVRPANGVLYGLGRIGTQAVAQLYTIDTGTGEAKPVGPRAIPLNGVAFGVDFNPVPDRLRIVSDAGQSIRVNPDNAEVVGTDTMIAYAAMGDPNSGRAPRVVAVAYTNPDTDGQTNTVLHDIDVARGADPDRAGDGLAIQVPPNAGTLNSVGALRVDVGDVGGFDIGSDNEAFAALQQVGSTFSRLYSIDLASGEATNLGRIGGGEVVNGLAIGLGPRCK
jgi:hypothetical protein